MYKGGEFGYMATVVDEINVIFNADISRFATALTNVENYAKQATTSISSMGNAITSLVALTGINQLVNGIKDLATASVEAYANLQQMETSFTALTGSAEKADAILRNIQAQKWNLPLQNIEDMTQGMLAVGMSGQQAVNSVRAVNDAASVLGIGASGANTISNALDKMILTGKVSALTIRPIVAQHVDAWGILANYLNTTIPKAQDMVKKGAISSAEAVLALTEGMTAKYSKGALEQLNTITGAFTNLKNDVTIIMQGIGRDIAGSSSGFIPFLAEITNFADKLATIVNSGKSVTEALKLLVPPAVLVGLQMLGIIVGSLLVGSFLKLAFTIGLAVIEALPFIAAGFAIVAVGYLLYENWQTLVEVLGTVGLMLLAVQIYMDGLTVATEGQTIALLANAAAWMLDVLPIVIVIGLVLGLIAVLAAAANSPKAAEAAFKAFIDYARLGFEKMKEDATASLGQLGVYVGQAIQTMLGWIKQLFDWLGIASQGVSGWVDNVKTNTASLQADMELAKKNSSDLAEGQVSDAQTYSDAVNKMADDAKASLGKIAGFTLPPLDMSQFKPPPIPSGGGRDAEDAITKATKAQKAHKVAVDQTATASEILTGQIKDINIQFEIFSLATGHGVGTQELYIEKLKVLGEEQALAAKKIIATKNELVVLSATEDETTKKMVQAKDAIYQSELEFAKYADAVRQAKDANDQFQISTLQGYIKITKNELEVWRLQTGHATTDTEYLRTKISYLTAAMQLQQQVVTDSIALVAKYSKEQGENAEATLKADQAVSQENLSLYQLRDEIKQTQEALAGTTTGAEWTQITANVKGLTRAIADQAKGTLQPSFTLPSGTDAKNMGQSFGANLTSGFKSGMQAGSPTLIERVLMAISDQAKKTFVDLMSLGPAMSLIGSKMGSLPSNMMGVGMGASKMTISPTLGAGTSALNTASKMSVTTSGSAVQGQGASPATAGGITVNQLIVREEADLQRIARLLFRMQQNQLRPKGITP
jgi:tape measure domain-containing protein